MTQKIKVLMVDDEKRFRETTRKLLEKKGFETILAATGEEALELMTTRPDVVVLDIKMPGMDGHETLKKIKSDNPQVPIIMLTGHGDRPSAREALVEGAFDYLSKPCDIDLLAEKIKEACISDADLSQYQERSLLDIMIPVEEYSTITIDKTIREAIEALRITFELKIATRQLMETGHRSILIIGKNGQIVGILTIKDLLDMILPDYLKAPKPPLADSMEYSPLFWKELFATRIKETQNQPVGDVMSPSPCTIDAGSNLMEAVYLMLRKKQRRLLVIDSGKQAGIIREQDLFFEMEKIITA